MREQRLVFGEDADLYDQARPSYPQELIDDVVALVGSGAHAVDVGCGTAKATVLLAQRGLRGVGIEADRCMAAVAEHNLGAYPGWRVVVSGFEEWQAEGTLGTFDLVCCAQAWHWLDPQVRLRKAHELLRPGGWLALWWNRPDDVDSPVRRATDQVYEALVPELPARGIGSKGQINSQQLAGEKLSAELAFGPPIQRAYRWSQEYSAEQWVALLQTQSDHRMLAPERLASLLAEISAAIDAHGGTYHHPYVCWLWAVQGT